MSRKRRKKRVYNNVTINYIVINSKDEKTDKKAGLTQKIALMSATIALISTVISLIIKFIG